MNFPKFPIGVESLLDKLHSISWTQIQKTLFLWLKFTSRVNSKKGPKYTTRVICGLSIFFFKKVNNTIMRGFAILFIEKVLKCPWKKKISMKKHFFLSYISSEVFQWTPSINNNISRLKLSVTIFNNLKLCSYHCS